ncbi:histidine phosphatase family protein [Pseudoalteromonas luteoviolacea]|uniref:SixA phosphatase family protein n=1 Tax=Pseudoalteromonas luteoviolacea TaxID=43657 RepID=UPI001B36E64D|nr:phosphoglycerate mutase family protein [Pseudoalteromonas luteoviolacea]MBQ4811227.1 histidine phosphatase family protein [Pseudoalteromonas luteoviolacea]
MRTLLFTALSLLTFSVFAMPENIVLLRHAEKQKGVDPSLTADGVKRARRIAQMMLPLEPTKLYSTDYNRTKATLAPLADLIDTHVAVYDARNLDGFARELKQKTGTVVVAGHSNTTPVLVKLLTNRDVRIEEDEFDKIFVVTFVDGEPKLEIKSSDK